MSLTNERRDVVPAILIPVSEAHPTRSTRITSTRLPAPRRWFSPGNRARLPGDLSWGLVPRAHNRGRGWTDARLAAGEERLRALGLLDGHIITHERRQVREAIETSTDAAMAGALAVLGDEIERSSPRWNR